MRKLATILAVVVLGSISFEMDATAEELQRLSGVQIRAKFTGMQLTDEVHWRYVYDRGGRLRSYSMGTKNWHMGGREGRTLSLSQGTGRWVLRSIAVGQTHRDETYWSRIVP